MGEGRRDGNVLFSFKISYLVRVKIFFDLGIVFIFVLIGKVFWVLGFYKEGFFNFEV